LAFRDVIEYGVTMMAANKVINMKLQDSLRELRWFDAKMKAFKKMLLINK